MTDLPDGIVAITHYRVDGQEYDTLDEARAALAHKERKAELLDFMLCDIASGGTWDAFARLLVDRIFSNPDRLVHLLAPLVDATELLDAVAPEMVGLACLLGPTLEKQPPPGATVVTLDDHGVVGVWMSCLDGDGERACVAMGTTLGCKYHGWETLPAARWLAWSTS